MQSTRTAGLATAATAASAPEKRKDGPVATPGVPPMLRYQAQLPRLPVPELAHTAALYLKSVEPLLTPTQLANTRNIVADFTKPGGLGEELTRRLRERAKTAPRSWFIDWWNELAYFAYRDPVVINVSYFFLFKDDERFRTQTGRAASLVQASLKFRDLILRYVRARTRASSRLGRLESKQQARQAREQAAGQGRPMGLTLCVPWFCPPPRIPLAASWSRTWPRTRRWT